MVLTMVECRRLACKGKKNAEASLTKAILLHFVFWADEPSASQLFCGRAVYIPN
ncbi:MAG: hypothetical protein II852_00975 [Bacteroidales bacterium]|nr:hypothetical protein [Bacteroidales bacterium]